MCPDCTLPRARCAPDGTGGLESRQGGIGQCIVFFPRTGTGRWQPNEKEPTVAKPTKYASLICAITSVVAVICILGGLAMRNSILILVGLTPSVAYEVYRTEGESTRWASWVMVGVLVLEYILLIFHIGFDLAGFLGASSQQVAGYSVPLGDIRIVGPAIMAVLAIVLIVRTRGVYTRWLAANIIVSVLALTYVLDPNVFQELLRQGVQEGMNQLN